MAYTYDDFVSAAQGAGLYDSFSQDDLVIAQNKPEYGMSMLKLQQDFNGAATAEQRLLAQEAMNQLRHSYTPAAPGYSYSGQDAYDKALQGVTQAPGYSFDQRTDPEYNRIKGQYQADIGSSKDKLLGSAGVTGGSFAPGYAGAAAGQSGNYYNTRLNDVIPTLEQNAYSRYLQELGITGDQFGAAAADKSFDYNKWLQEQQLDMAGKQQQFANDMTLHQNFGTDLPSMPDLNGSTMAEVQYTYGRDEEYRKALDKVLNREGFTYDAGSDPLYGSLRKSYLREGQRAGEDALAQGSAATGGMPSSYAIRAAADVQNGYLEQLMNGVPTLQDNAFSRYLQGFRNDLGVLGQLQEDKQLDYNQWLQNYQLEQQRQQQIFDNALAMYQTTGMTPEIAAALGIPYVAPSYDAGAGYGGGTYYTADEAAAINFVDNMLGNASGSRFDPERVIGIRNPNGTYSGTNALTDEQKELALEYLRGAIESGRMKSGASRNM